MHLCSFLCEPPAMLKSYCQFVVYRTWANVIWKVLRGWKCTEEPRVPAHSAFIPCLNYVLGSLLKMDAGRDRCLVWFLHSQACALGVLRREAAPRGKKKDEIIMIFYLGVTSFQRSIFQRHSLMLANLKVLFYCFEEFWHNTLVFQ